MYLRDQVSARPSSVSPASRLFPEQELVQLHSQAEHRKRHASSTAYREGGKVNRSTEKRELYARLELHGEFMFRYTRVIFFLVRQTLLNQDT